VKMDNSKKLLEFSPAKLNLSLEVLGKRPDGYHDIRSLMIQLDLGDEVSVEVTDDGEIECNCDNPRVPVGKDNIAWMAARVFLEKTEEKQGVKINIAKRIPPGGGLAGGSGNAAAVLRALNKLLGDPLDREQLARAGLEVGSDVPFLLQRSPAWVEGRGERISPARVPEDWVYLIIDPGFEVSTAWAYGDLPLTTVENENNIVYPYLEGIKMVNHLERAVFRRYPLLRKLKEEVLESGAMASLMSGSGATIFGVYPDIQAAAAAGKILGTKHGQLNVFTARMFSGRRCEGKGRS